MRPPTGCCTRKNCWQPSPIVARHGHVHGAALRAGQDPRAAGAWAVVQSHDLDADVQRFAERAGHPRPLPVLVLPVSDAQPFWVSAAQLRRDLAEMRQVLDPQHREPALDQMVLVGHSMGGLVAKLQTLNSGYDFWNLASHMPLEQLRAEPETRERLRETFFFQPNPSIRRVITIATPHHGSTFSNQTTQYLLDKVIHPDFLVNAQEKLFRDNKDLLFSGSLLKINTSIDSLAPNTPIFPLMLMPRSLPWVKYHNIIGVVPGKWWLSRFIGESDGVVSESRPGSTAWRRS